MRSRCSCGSLRLRDSVRWLAGLRTSRRAGSGGWALDGERGRLAVGDRGAAAAELAVAMPAVIVILVVLVTAGMASYHLVRAASLSGGLARAAARGESGAELERLADRFGLDASYSVQSSEAMSCVSVTPALFGTETWSIALPPVTVCSANIGD